MPLRLALYEPEADGHHMALYTRNILREALLRGWEVVLVTTQRAIAHPAYELIRSEFEGRIDVEVMEDRQTDPAAGDIQRLKDQFARLANYRKAHKDLTSRRPIDVAFMVNLDQADLPMAICGSPFGRTPFLGILIGRQFHCPKVGIKMDPLKRRDKLFEPAVRRVLALKRLKAMLVVDETMERWAQQEKPKGWEKLRHVADPAGFSGVMPKAEARQALGICQEDFVVLLYGALSERKGVGDLLAALKSPECPRTAVGLLAGRQDEFTRNALDACELASRNLEDEDESATSARVYTFNRFLNDEDEARVLSACDVVWLGYKHWFGSSGVMYQACAAGKPVLAMDRGLVGWAVEQYGIGVTCATEKPETVARILGELIQHPHRLEELSKNGARVAAEHSPEQFGRTICDWIERSRQSPPV